MKRTILFIVYDIVFHIERKINYFILFIYFYLFEKACKKETRKPGVQNRTIP
jgi:hypothetical protein